MAEQNKGEPSEEELEELEEEIEHARRDGEEAMHGSFYEGDQHMFVSSGDESSEDESDIDDEARSGGENLAP